MARSGIHFDFRGMTKQAARLKDLSTKQLPQVQQRALSTLARRLPVEASRLASERIVNLPRATVRKGLSASVGGPASERYVLLSGERRRIPLAAFGANYGGRGARGALAKPYRDSSVRTYDHTFAIKGRGVKGGIWMRVPRAGGKLVSRLPIIQRKGPSIARVIADRKHGDIIPELSEFCGTILRAEIARLLKSGASP